MFFVFSVHGNTPISGGGRVGVGKARGGYSKGLFGRGFLNAAKTPPWKAMCRHELPTAPLIVSDPAGKRERKKSEFCQDGI